MKKYLAEFIGTFVLTLFGCGVAVVTGCSLNNMGAYVATAFAFGLSVVAMAYSMGNISGGHFNPAVSIAMLVDGKLTMKDFGAYIVSQCLGALAGAGILAVFVGRESGLGANGLINGNVVLSLLAEIILTFVFVLCIMGAVDKAGNNAGLVIGLALVLVHLLGIGLGTGTSVNPARSFGPAVLAGGAALSSLWVFICAPLIGGALASYCYKFLKQED